MTRGRASAAALAVLCALAAWHLVLRGHGRGVPLITDEGEYAVAARAWSGGGLPYRDAFTQKPPMVIAFYRAAGVFTRDPHAPRAWAALAGALTALLLFLAAPWRWSIEARLAAPAAFAALGALPVGDYGFPANTETLVNLFSALSAALLLRGRPLAAGLAAGAMLCSKQTSLWTLAAFAGAGAWLERREPRARSAARFLAGAAAVPAAWAGYFALRGALPDYWEAAWSGNARYARALLMTGALEGQLRWFAGTLLPSLALFSAPALALAAWGLRGGAAGPARRAETLAVLWFGSAAAGALTGLFLFPHYFLALAPGLALAAAAGVQRLRRAPARRGAVAALALWPVLLAPWMIAAPARERGLRLLHPNPLFETRFLAAELASRARPGDRLHVFGSEGALFAYSGLPPATRHTLVYALTLFPAGPEPRRELAALRADPPRFVVWSTQPLSTMIATRAGLEYAEGLRDLLAERYRYEGAVRVTGEEPELSRGGRPDFGSEDALLLFERRDAGAPKKL